MTFETLYIDLPGSLILVLIRVFTGCHCGCLGDSRAVKREVLGAI